jgi:hypothetical protein
MLPARRKRATEVIFSLSSTFTPELLKRHRDQVRNVVHSSLGEFDYLLCNESRCRIIDELEAQCSAHFFKREGHFADRFGIKSVTREEWTYRHPGTPLVE